MQFNELCRSLHVLVLRPAVSLLGFMDVDQSERICVILYALVSMRRITKATDNHVRKLAVTRGLKGRWQLASVA